MTHCPYCNGEMRVTYEPQGPPYPVYAECTECHSQGPMVVSESVPSEEDCARAMELAQQRREHENI